MKKRILFTADCLEGTKDLVEQELLKLGDSLELFSTERKDSVVFAAQEDYSKLKSLRKITALYYLLCFPVKGPGSLLKMNYLADINLHILKAVKNSFDYSAKSFRINAAGETSKTYQELCAKIEHFTGLHYNQETGDLLIRIRNHPSGKAWEVLIRLSSRPLSCRPWREFNFKGALNPILAAVLYDLTGLKKQDRLLNAMSGSGTILIEAAQRHKLSKIVGCDIDDEVIDYSKKHLRNANVKNVDVLKMDARNMDFSDESFDGIIADLPWGENIGTRDENLALYCDFLKEAKRVLVKKGKIGLITQDIKKLEQAIKVNDLNILHQRKVYQGGFHPEIFILQK